MGIYTRFNFGISKKVLDFQVSLLYKTFRDFNFRSFITKKAKNYCVNLHYQGFVKSVINGMLLCSDLCRWDGNKNPLSERNFRRAMAMAKKGIVFSEKKNLSPKIIFFHFYLNLKNTGCKGLQNRGMVSGCNSFR